MDFVVNEQGCNDLIESMNSCMSKIKKIIDDIDSKNTTLKEALGDDAQAVSSSVRTMRAELENAEKDLSNITTSMKEYVSRVGTIKKTLT